MLEEGVDGEIMAPLARHRRKEIDTLIDECALAEAKETHHSEAQFMTNVTAVRST